MLIPVYEELKTSLRTCGLPLRYVAYRAGTGRQTLKWWLDGKVNFPRIDTMLKVATVLGYHIELTPTVKKMVAFYPKQQIKPPPIIRPRLEQWLQ